MIGRTISHYKILEKLGEGGMGIVYKAHDTTLDRIVALKFLPHYLTSDPAEKERFYHEARAAAALTHQNIAVIHEIVEHEDQSGGGRQIFIAMECVEGRTLKQFIEPEIPPVKKTLEIAIQICEGLSAAHEKGIVHRDIKSENIILTPKSQAKIMDFGLAKLKGATKLTKAGSTLGTAAYMSPEQARGEDVDHRSDIFSLGVVLYEMLTAHLPFRGEHLAAIQYSIVNEDPPLLARYNEKLTDELQHIVSKTLEKEVDDRYQHVDELLSDLRRERKKLEYAKAGYSRSSLAVAGSPPHEPAPQGVAVTEIRAGKKTGRAKYAAAAAAALILLLAAYTLFFREEADGSVKIPIAVIDFVNETGDGELNGLSGLLITDLEQSRKLEVLTRSRMFDLLNKMKFGNPNHIDEAAGRVICTNSGVDLMAAGTVRKFGEMYSVDLKIIDVKSGKHVFAAKADRKGKESIPSLIDEIAERTRTELQEAPASIQERNKKVAEITTTSLEAYQHYFQGENLINRLKFKEAQEEFRKAIAIDSLFGLAYYRLGYAISWFIRSEELAREPMHKAMALIDRMPEREKFLVRSEYARIEQNMEAALAILREMEKTYPSDKEMIYLIGDYSWHLGKTDEAIKYLEKVLSIDPNFERALQHLSWAYRTAGRYEMITGVAKRYVAVSGSSEAYQILTEAYILSDRYDLAISIIKEAIVLDPGNYIFPRLLAFIHARGGDYGEAERELKKLIAPGQLAKFRRAGYQALAIFYPYLGKYKESLECIDRAIDLDYESRDTSSAETLRMLKAILIYNGWHDIRGAWEEAAKSFPLREKINSGNYFGGLSLLMIYRGDYREIDSLTKTEGGWWHLSVLSMIESAKGNCSAAESITDSVMKVGMQFGQIFVLYQLAECQYGGGSPEKAVISLKKLQTLHDFDNMVGARPMFYPKSIYLMGKAYEKKGDKKEAMNNYRKFLELWRGCDKDLPDYVDAKKRAARLEGISAR